MKDFYTLAKELRQALRELYPNGYVKVTEGKDSTTIKIINFAPVPLLLAHFEVTNSGTATIIDRIK